MYTLVKIEPFPDGAHDNVTVESCDNIPEGWALVPEGQSTGGFPYGEITTAVVDGVTIVTGWTRIEPPSESLGQLREYARHRRKMVEWGGVLYTVAEATALWVNYASEGRDTMANALKSEIAVAKQALRNEYNDYDSYWA